MKRGILIVIALLTSFSLQAQSLSISEDAATRGNSITQFSMGTNTLEISSALDDYEAVANDLGTKAQLLNAEVTIMDKSGNTIYTVSKEVDGSDESVKIYVLNDGSFVVREIISNFDFYDSFGNVKFNVNNNTNSQDGELISELVMDPAGKTMVVYNPKIIFQGATNSRASVITTAGKTKEIFYSQESAIKHVEISDDGSFISIVTEANTVYLYDAYGNEINAITFDQDVKGASWSENGRFVTIYSGGRAAVYNVINGERVGSTSFRGSSVLKATYFPADKVILALTGDVIATTLTNIQFHAVNVDARKIARENYSGGLGYVETIPLSMTRSGRNNYSVNGLSKALRVKATF